MSNARNLARLLPNASGQLPTGNLQDAAVTAAKFAATASSGYYDIGNVRIQWTSGTTYATPVVSSGFFANYYSYNTVGFPVAFKAGTIPKVVASLDTNGYHDGFVAGLVPGATAVAVGVTCSRADGISSRPFYVFAIGEKP